MKRIVTLLILCFTLPCLAQVQVKNGRQGKGPNFQFVFEEDLRIGADCETADCLWSGANVGVTVDQKGHMYVTDPGGNRIVIYDDKGVFLKSFGSAGQGPGEFTQLNSYQILADQSGVAFDNNQTVISFSFFDESQRFKDKTTLQPGKRFIQKASYSPNGKHIAAMYVNINTENPGQAGTVHTGILNPKMEPTMTFSDGTQVMFDINRLNDSGWWSEFLADWFRLVHQGVGTMAFAEDGTLYSAMTTTYEITKYTPDLKPKLIIQKDYKPHGLPEDQLLAFVEPVHEEITSILPPEMRSIVTPKVIQKALELAEFPPRKQPIFALLPVEEHGLLVIHNHNPLNGETSADFFDENGIFKGRTKLPGLTVNIFAGFFGNGTNLIFQNGYAYSIQTSEDGDRHLVRYTYKIVPSTT